MSAAPSALDRPSRWLVRRHQQRRRAHTDKAAFGVSALGLKQAKSHPHVDTCTPGYALTTNVVGEGAEATLGEAPVCRRPWASRQWQGACWVAASAPRIYTHTVAAPPHPPPLTTVSGLPSRPGRAELTLQDSGRSSSCLTNKQTVPNPVCPTRAPLNRRPAQGSPCPGASGMVHGSPRASSKAVD